MQNQRIIHWDDVELPFDSPPSSAIPSLADLAADLNAGVSWVWVYKGLPGVLSLDVMRQEYETCTAMKQQRHRREPVPKQVGKFRWSQTTPTAFTKFRLPP